MSWLIAEFHIPNLFSFKKIKASNTSAKTLLIPTPFAVKTAIVASAINHTGNVKKGKEMFEIVKNLEIRFKPPKKAIINQNQRSITSIRGKGSKKEGNKRYEYNSKPAFKEYVKFSEENFKIAFELNEELEKEENKEFFLKFLRKVTHLGGGESFVQFMNYEITEKLDDNYSKKLEDFDDLTKVYDRLKQPLEDVGNDTFEGLSIHNSNIKQKRERKNQAQFLPLVESRANSQSQFYSFYR